METKKILTVLFTLLTIIVISNKAFSKADAIIYCEKTGSDTVDLGMTLVNGSLFMDFTIRNTGDKPLKFGITDYSFALKLFPGHPFEFLEFDKAAPFQNDIPVGGQEQVQIRYSANLGMFPPGTKMCILRLGVFDPEKVSQPTSDNDLVKYRDFVLIAHKASHAIEGYQKVIDFDSVWINATQPQKINWTLFNNMTYDITVNQFDFVRFFLSKITHNLSTPFVAPAEQTKDFQIAYYPTSVSGWGRDTANLKIIYPPNPLKSDSLDSAQVSIYGVGVEQKIELIAPSVDSNARIEGNNIVVNDVPEGEYRDIKVAVQNNGNIPFGIKSQIIYDIASDVPAEGLGLLKGLNDTLNLLPTQVDTFVFRFKPVSRKSVYGRLVVNSDIMDRKKIHAAPDSASQVIFYIRGVGVAPEINLAKDTVDFGNILVNGGDCPSVRDTSVVISNIGNMFLRVSGIMLDPPYPTTPFNVLNLNLDIPPYTSRNLRLRFEPIATEAKIYNSTLVLISNSKAPKDTLRIQLKALGINPDTTNLILPQVKSMPGRRIKIPILVNKEKMSIAKSYIDTLYFDKSLLRFYNLITLNTASEDLTQKDAFESVEGGKVYINLGTDYNRYLGRNDTLAILTFDTFLGDKLTTPLVFSQSGFGDGICAHVLTPHIRNGSFTLDSICGLENKISILPKTKFAFEVQSINQYPEYFTIYFNLPFDDLTEINLYDSFGELVSNILNENTSEGEHLKKISTSELVPGVYYCEMKAGIFRSVKSVLITK